MDQCTYHYSCFPLGMSEYAISGNLGENVNVRSSGWRKIEKWRSDQDSGHFHSGPEKFIDQGSAFHVERTGIYSVYITVTVSGAQQGLVKLGVFADEMSLAEPPLLESCFVDYEEEKSLSVFSSLFLDRRDKISVYVYSEIDPEWTIIGKSKSTFSMQFLGFSGYIPGFSTRLPKDLKPLKNSKNILQEWTSNEGKGLYRSMTGFSDGSGIYSVPADGIYQSSFSLQIKATVETKIAIRVILNNAGSVSEFSTDLGIQTITISSSTSLKLSKGDSLHIETSGKVDTYTIESGSSFSVIFLSMDTKGKM